MRRRRDHPGGRIVQPGNECHRGQPLQAAMRPATVVVDPPLVGNKPSLTQAQEQLLVEQLVAEPAVEALHVAVLPGARFLNVERADACPRQPLLDPLATNSRPLSLRRCLGAPRTANRYWSVMIAFRALNDLATSMARDSRVNSSIIARIPNCLPFSVHSVRKS